MGGLVVLGRVVVTEPRRVVRLGASVQELHAWLLDKTNRFEGSVPMVCAECGKPLGIKSRSMAWSDAAVGFEDVCAECLGLLEEQEG